MDACTCNPKWIGCSSMAKFYAGHRGTKGLNLVGPIRQQISIIKCCFHALLTPHKFNIGEFYTLLSRLGLQGWNGTTLIEKTHGGC